MRGQGPQKLRADIGYAGWLRSNPCLGTTNQLLMPNVHHSDFRGAFMSISSWTYPAAVVPVLAMCLHLSAGSDTLISSMGQTNYTQPQSLSTRCAISTVELEAVLWNLALATQRIISAHLIRVCMHGGTGPLPCWLSVKIHDESIFCCYLWRPFITFDASVERCNVGCANKGQRLL